MKHFLLFISLIVLSSSLWAVPILNPENGHYYESISTAINWATAKAAAESMSYLGMQGHLATITSLSENSFITSNLTFSGYFLGGFQAPGTAEPLAEWQWVTGEAFTFSYWGSGEPNDSGGEDALHFRADGLWNDINLVNTYGYIVEYDNMMPEPSVCILFLLGLAGYALRLRKSTK